MDMCKVSREFVIGVAALSAAVVALPSDQTVDYKAYKYAGGPLKWVYTLSLHAVDEAGGDYAWEVTEIEIRKVAAEALPELDEYWRETYPAVSTPDGYWWVSNAGGASDFRQPPLISGRAIADDPNNDDIDYTYLGRPLQGSQAKGDYWVQRVGASAADADEEDDDVDVPGGVRDPH